MSAYSVIQFSVRFSFAQEAETDFEQRIIETNNEINIAIINSRADN